MKVSLARRLAAGVVVGDGGWGTMLAERGLPAGAPPELWTLQQPEILAEIARAYVDAGAELITTNTFGASPMRLSLHRLGDRFEEINRRGVEIVRAAVGDEALVSASIGPTGRLLAPLGDADPAEVSRGFAEQARILVAAGADVLCIETMTDLEEATLAVRAARSISEEIAIIASMTFDITPRGPFTVMGVSVPQAAERLASAGATLVGSNCGAGVEEMRIVAKAFVEVATVPVAIQPNAGLPRRQDGILVYPESPDRFAAAVAAMAATGVGLVGGCCGTTPAHIAALRRRIGR
jgi:5-methyltetrahydrofolate--homocysteine methyltransferase